MALFGMAGGTRAAEIEPPVHLDEAKIIQQIIAVEKYQPEVTPIHGYVQGGIKRVLTNLGVETKNLRYWQIVVKNDPRPQRGGFFACAYDTKGRVLALSGNGPWLRNETLRALKAMPELRCIHWDHNGFVGTHPEVDLYDGTGFEALTESQLQDIKIGLSFNDKGMEQVSNIKGLKHFTVAHARTSEAGIKFFEGHPSLESFTVAEMGKVNQKALASIAKMPKVTHVGFQEAFITYDGGFEHLLPMKGRLKNLDLTMSVVNEDDLKRVRADHPDVKITIIPPAEIVKRHSGIANNLARIATGEAAEKLKKAIAEHKTDKK
jgi:hypothetical protein